MTNSIDLLNRQLHFVCGKGGVGKSTVSCALAYYFAGLGRNSLLVQINAKDTHSSYLDCKAIDEQIVQVMPNLWAVNMSPEAALKEYLLLKLHSKHVYNLVFKNPLVKRFLKFLPSLTELNLLGKIWFHVNEKRSDGGPKFDKIIIDCPATGHSLQLLTVADTTYKAVKKGPIAHEAQKVAQTIKDPSKSAVHVVTLPEDLPVNEALQLLQKIKEDDIAALGLAFINNVSQILCDGALRSNDQENDLSPKMKAIHDVLVYRKEAEADESEQISRLNNDFNGIMPIILPKILASEIKLSALKKFAKIIGGLTNVNGGV